MVHSMHSVNFETKDDADVTMRPEHMFCGPASVPQCVSEIVHSFSEVNTKHNEKQ